MLPLRRRETRLPLPTICAAIIAAITAMLIASPNSDADPGQDIQFYGFLSNHSMVVYNPDLVKAQGLRVCRELGSGLNWRITITRLRNVGYTLEEAAIIMSAAVQAYCPWQATNIIHESSVQV